jgi:hypothetical protein
MGLWGLRLEVYFPHETDANKQYTQIATGNIIQVINKTTNKPEHRVLTVAHVFQREGRFNPWLALIYVGDKILALDVKNLNAHMDEHTDAAFVPILGQLVPIPPPPAPTKNQPEDGDEQPKDLPEEMSKLNVQ